ncbi:MAG: helix-turn-helix domain-containing protein [Halioglobus sp.]
MSDEAFGMYYRRLGTLDWTKNSLLLYVTMLTYRNSETHECFASAKRLADDCGWSQVDQVSGPRKKLIAMGLVEKIGGGHNGKTAIYVVHDRSIFDNSESVDSTNHTVIDSESENQRQYETYCLHQSRQHVSSEVDSTKRTALSDHDHTKLLSNHTDTSNAESGSVFEEIKTIDSDSTTNTEHDDDLNPVDHCVSDEPNDCNQIPQPIDQPKRSKTVSAADMIHAVPKLRNDLRPAFGDLARELATDRLVRFIAANDMHDHPIDAAKRLYTDNEILLNSLPDNKRTAVINALGAV